MSCLTRPLRVFSRHRGSSVVLIALLTLGIAVNSALFCVVDGVLFKPLPFPSPERLITIGNDATSGRYRHPAPVTASQFRSIAADPRLSAAAAVVSLSTENWTAAGDASVRAVAVTAAFFQVLAVSPLMGRALRAADVGAAGATPVVIGYSLWAGRHGREPSLLGRTVTFGRVRAVIVGVMPPGFDFPDGTNLWTVIEPATVGAADDFAHLRVIARLKAGVPASAVASREGVRQESLREYVTPEEGWSLATLLLACIFVLLLTWIQIGSLQMARMSARSRQIGVQLALGATRWRLALEAVEEAAVLAVASLTLAVVAAHWFLTALLTVLPGELTRGQPIGVDARTIAFGGVLCAAGLAVCALGPLVNVWRAAPVTLISSSPRSPTHSRGRTGLTLLVAQVALSTTLLYLACLTVQTFISVNQVDLGFRPNGLVAVHLNADALGDSEVARHDRFRLLTDDIRRTSGVAAVAGATGRPLGGLRTYVEVGDGSRPERIQALMTCVTPGFFSTLGTTKFSGRDFDAADRMGGRLAAIVSVTTAHRLSRRVTETDYTIRVAGLPMTVVGVFADSVVLRPDEPAVPQVFVPARQWLAPRVLLVRLRPGVVRPPASLVSLLRSGLADRIDPLQEEVTRATSPQQSRMVVALVLACVGAALCAIGMYGAISYAVHRRRTELAIRLALGALPGDLTRLILGRAGVIVAAGVIAGLASSAIAGRLAATVLFRVRPLNVTAVLVSVLVVTASCMLAAARPALAVRAMGPVEVLRTE